MNIRTNKGFKKCKISCGLLGYSLNKLYCGFNLLWKQQHSKQWMLGRGSLHTLWKQYMQKNLGVDDIKIFVDPEESLPIREPPRSQ
ncbi:hypothetical protein BKP45_14160 [Anaerobacillus alkalidiazotrophicus]|uniref:Uncharacterized protein n=1 Tax=Anaerobacillus alkalidiazotrophicus TaxID=472963 RepID=A0A1S2M3W2_9BACI|nr:hypothetical protein BKP45_14160 [Anaerobacillus alkalidiazotrophicus]